MESSHQHRLGTQNEGGSFAASSSHRGRLSSWVAVAVLIAGFVAVGAGIIAGPPWIVLIIGLVLLAVGGIMAYVVDLWRDVVLTEPRKLPEEPHRTPRSGAEADEERQRVDEAPPEKRRDHPRDHPQD